MAGQLDEPALEPRLPGLPRKIEGIDRDAVAAQARPRVKRHEAEGFGLRRVDHFPDTDVHLVAHQRDFVHQADVHRPEGVLEQLHHLGHPRRTDRHDTIDRGPIQRAGGLGACLAHPADDFRDVPRVVILIARIHPFRREREEEVDIRLQPFGLEHRLDDLVGRSGIGRRLEDDELAAPERRGHRLDCQDDVRKVGVSGFSERRRHADVDCVHLAELTDVEGRPKLARLDRCSQGRCGHVRNVALAGVDLRRLRVIDVETGDVESLARKFDRKRQADVAEPDDAHARLPRANPFENGTVMGMRGHDVR